MPHTTMHSARKTIMRSTTVNLSCSRDFSVSEQGMAEAHCTFRRPGAAAKARKLLNTDAG